MSLELHTKFRALFEEGSKPTKGEIRQWVEDGEVPGEVIGKKVFVDINRWLGRNRQPAVQTSTIPNLHD